MDATDLCFTSALDLGRLIRSREVSPVEIANAVLARVTRPDLVRDGPTELSEADR